MPMSRVPQEYVDAHIDWIDPRTRADGWLTGMDAGGWQSDVWVLHTLYANGDLAGRGTHDSLHRQAVAEGLVEPDVVGGVSLEGMTVIGVDLGFERRPPSPWRPVRWQDAGLTAPPDQQPVPPCYRWLVGRGSSLGVEYQGASEGSMDEASLETLLEVLAAASVDGRDTECLIHYAYMSSHMFWPGEVEDVEPQLWRGPLGAIPDMVAEFGGPVDYTPNNFWPIDRSWFVFTDHDLSATKVSGSAALVRALEDHPLLDTLHWPVAGPTADSPADATR